jgi:hypothetical protein
MTKVEIKCTENGPNLIAVDGNVVATMCRRGCLSLFLLLAIPRLSLVV